MVSVSRPLRGLAPLMPFVCAVAAVGRLPAPRLGRMDQPVQPFARLDDGRPDGAWGSRVIGTYLHGAFENAAVCLETFGVNVATVSKADDYRRLGESFATHASRPDVLEC